MHGSDTSDDLSTAWPYHAPTGAEEFLRIGFDDLGIIPLTTDMSRYGLLVSLAKWPLINEVEISCTMEKPLRDLRQGSLPSIRKSASPR